MSTIEYKGVKYRPSQLWPLVRALQADGWTVGASAFMHGGFWCFGFTFTTGRHVFCTPDMHGKTPFLALGKLVDEIKKEGEK